MEKCYYCEDGIKHQIPDNIEEIVEYGYVYETFFAHLGCLKKEGIG